MSRLGRRIALLATLALGCDLDRAPAKYDRLGRLEDALQSVRFVAYTPRGFEPGVSPPPSEAALRGDLALLRTHFDGIITYSASYGLDRLPALARELGFRAAIVGVWNPTDREEVDRALAAARAEPETVVAVALGNEGLFFDRYNSLALEAAFSRARSAAPDVPLAVSEPFSVYLDSPQLLPRAELWLPIVHPIDQPWFATARPEASIQFVTDVVVALREKFPRGRILVKETGLPSGPNGDGFSESGQAAFWSELSKRLPRTHSQAFAWFEAFDAPWKPAHAVQAPPEKRAREAFFGLLRADGSAKPALEEVR